MIGNWANHMNETVQRALQDLYRRWIVPFIRRIECAMLITPILLVCSIRLLPGVAAGQTFAEPEANLGVMLAIDNSNSMFDKGGIGSDPDLWRIEAAQMFINYLGIDSASVSHRLGVIFFGGQARLVVPLTPLADQERRKEIAALIAEPQRMNWTNPTTALALSRDTLIADTGSDHKPVVILLTDGKPEWDSQPTEAEQQATIDALQYIGQQYARDHIRLFVILLSNEATDADGEISSIYVPLWKDIAGETDGDFFQVRRADDLVGIYHDILVTLSEVRTDGAVIDAEVDGETQVEVISMEPNLARVTFVVRVGHPDIEVTIHRPGGQELRPMDDDVQQAARGATAIWAVTQPVAGDWMVVMSGQGNVTVWKDYLPAPATPTPSPMPTPTPFPTSIPRAIVAELPEVVLAGQPLTLSVSFRPTPSKTPIVWGEWRPEIGDPVKVRLLDDGREGDVRAKDGHYSALLTPAKAGVGLVRVWGETGDYEVAEWKGRLRVEERPVLEIVEPRPEARWRAGNKGIVIGRWVVGKHPIEATGKLTATLFAADGSAPSSASGTAGELITLDAPQTTGVYTIVVAAVGHSATGLYFEDTIGTTVEIYRPLPWWMWIIAAGIPVVGLVSWRLYLTFKRLPRVEGRLRVLEAPSDYAGPVLLDLSQSGRRSVRLGGMEAELPLPANGEPWAVIRALSDGTGMELVLCDGKKVSVNKDQLTDNHLLTDNDHITFGEAKLRYEHLRYRI